MCYVKKGDILLCNGLEIMSPNKFLARVESTHFDGFFKVFMIRENKLDKDLTVVSYESIIRNFGKINYKTFKADYPEYTI